MGRTVEQDMVRKNARVVAPRRRFGAARHRGSALSWTCAALLALAACSDDDAGGTETSGCVTGQAVLCECQNGSNGVQLCGRDGVFGGCFCMPLPPSNSS